MDKTTVAFDNLNPEFLLVDTYFVKYNGAVY